MLAWLSLVGGAEEGIAGAWRRVQASARAARPGLKRAAPGRGTAGATRKRGPGPGVELESRVFARSSAVSRTLFGIWAVIAAFLLPVRAGAEEEEEREHFQLKLSPSYDEGGFGTSERTRAFVVPLTVRYLGEKFDVAATFSFVRIDSPGDVVILEGTPTATGRVAGARRVDSGFGDIVLKGRYFLIEDPGLPSPVPSIVPFVKLKIPTGDASKNLSTGEPDWGFGDASYTVIGDPEGSDFRNRPAASIGAGYKISDLVTVSGLLDWRRALVASRDDPLELLWLATFRITRTLAVTPNVLVGLTNGSPDWGIGIELSYKFGRW